MSEPAQPARTEASIALPTRPLLAAIVAITVSIAVLWAALVLIAGWDRSLIEAVTWGAAMTGFIAAGATLAMTPWKARPIASWMTFWLGATVLRLFITPAAAWLLYSATSLDLEALCLAVAATYFLSVLTEAWIIARHVKKVLPTK